MTTLALVLISVTAFACFLSGLPYQQWRSRSVRFDGRFVYVGSPRKAKRLVWTDITEISIAPHYDVAPADDYWLLQGKSTEPVGFWGQDEGATAALAHLEAALPGFDIEKSITHAHANSVFEEAVVVWRADQ